jgi:hypothetical protein
MVEPIDIYIRKLESMLADALWLGCESPLIEAALDIAYSERERGETHHVFF